MFFFYLNLPTKNYIADVSSPVVDILLLIKGLICSLSATSVLNWKWQAIELAEVKRLLVSATHCAAIGYSWTLNGR